MELDDLPASHGLSIDQPQLGVRLILGLAKEIIAHALRIEPGSGVTLWHVEQQFAERRIADFQFELRVNR